MENKLTTQEKELLKQIINDKYSVAPFSGMILNAVVSTNDYSDANKARLIKEALSIRLALTELTK